MTAQGRNSNTARELLSELRQSGITARVQDGLLVLDDQPSPEMDFALTEYRLEVTAELEREAFDDLV